MDFKLLPKILYIDDTDEARSLVGRLLAGRCTMLEANDPIAGIELARETRPDLILLDMHFPTMTGIEVVARLLAVLGAGTPIVALTADCDPEMRTRALAAGFSGFISKPIEIDAFFVVIDPLLYRDRQEELPDIAGDLSAYRESFRQAVASKSRSFFAAPALLVHASKNPH
jgi:CheY-like chemotaxis protein